MKPTKQQALYEKSLHTLEYYKILERVKECAASPWAKEKIGSLMPCTNLADAQRAQQETADAKRLMEKWGSPSIYGVKDVTSCAKRAEIGAVLSPRELLDVAGLMKTCRGLKSYREAEEENTCIDGYFDAMVANKYMEDRICDAILAEDEIADTASSELADIRRKMKNAGQKVRDVLNKIIHSQSYQKALQEPIVSMRGDRYVIPVRSECRGQVPGLIHDTSASGQTIFVEPMAVVEANNELRVLAGREKKEIERILAELSLIVGDSADQVVNNYQMAAYLDFVFAKAAYARKTKGVEPKLNDQGRIDLRRSRHPLLDQETVVPTDVYLGKDFDTLVITGPNTGGKTVALKTMGLFTVMACAGLQIPAAEESEVAVFDGVYADIGDEQSIEQSLSTFSSHMTNIVNILSCVDSNSLVLFDELGAGTDPVEGAALAIAIIEKIRGVGAKVAATTHYSELKTFALSTDGVENGSCEFDVQTLRPTYKLLIGIPGKSNAFAISSKLGLSEDIIEAAKGKVAKENIQFEDILTDLETQRQEMEKQKNLAQFHAEEMERLRADLQKERDHYKATRENAIRQAKLEAGRIIEQAKFASEKAMEEIERLRKQKIDEEIQHKMSVSRSIIKGALNKVDLHKDDPDALRRPNIPYRKQKFHVGDTVTILNLNKTATVETLPDRNGNLTVVAGVMRVAVNERDIRIDNTMVKKDKNDQTGMKYIKNSTDRMNRTVKTEVDLRGMDGEQALVELEKYLDDAVVSGLHQVTIIHGKGTGVLRNVVQQRLKGHPHVKSFRLGKYGEGETGVTIAELK